MKSTCTTSKTIMSFFLFLAVLFCELSTTYAQETEKKSEAAVVDSEKPEAEPTDDAVLDDLRQTALISKIVLKVINPKQTREEIEEKADNFKGYPVLVTNDSLQIKVPPEKLSDFLAFVAEKGLIIEKTLEREDLTQEIAQLEGKLKSKRSILAKLRGFLMIRTLPPPCASNRP